MADGNSRRKGSTATIRVVCAVLFCAFSFLWLYYFQADLLALLQHVLSNGQTHYHRVGGAVLITLLLLLLAQLVYLLVRLRHRTHALCYLPSMLVLAMMSDVNPSFVSHQTFGPWLWLVPLILIVWLGVVWLARQLMPFGNEQQASGIFSRQMWCNSLIMSLMMIGVASFSNTNAVFHFRMHAETALLEKNFDEALRVGNESLETDVSLTMLRAFALFQKGELGEHLFEYPIEGKGKDLLPLQDSEARLLMLPADSLWKALGARPAHPMKYNEYLRAMRALQGDSLYAYTLADYELCSLLIDRKLDAFAKLLPEFFAINDALPRHYREALTVYNHQGKYPVTVYHNTVMDEDWKNLQQLKKEYPLASERKLKTLNKYEGTYWYYYFYGR